MKSESEAISVENELTNIQVEIAKIKTRMNNIENDVAYSYIDLTVNEVREYTAEPVIEKTDTFRLPGTDMDRTIVVVRKIRPTPARFPRKAGLPSKEPLS